MRAYETAGVEVLGRVEAESERARVGREAEAFELRAEVDALLAASEDVRAVRVAADAHHSVTHQLPSRSAPRIHVGRDDEEVSARVRRRDAEVEALARTAHADVVVR